MYKVALTQSVFPAQSDHPVLETTVGALLRRVATERPDAPALVEVDGLGATARRWTFGDLMDDAERLAQALSTRIEPGERICVWAPNIPEWVLMEYACGLAGLILVTANPAYQVAELRYVLEQSRSVALFHTKEYRGNPMADIAVQATDGLGAMREVVDLEDPDALYAHGDRSVALPDIGPDDPVQIQYTSGTTGFPKGAVISHRSITNNARFFTLRTGGSSASRIICVMPLFHTAGCGMTVLGALQIGAPVYLLKLFDPVALLRLIEREGITMMMGVPTMIVGILEAQKTLNCDLSTVEIVVSGGSMVAPDLVRRTTEVFGCAFQTVYGQTECAPLITQHYLGETLEDICGSVGQPIPQTEVSIWSVDTNEAQPIDQIGEICVRGYCTMIGYNDNPEATAATIDREGWLHTGDLGAMDARGYVRVTGRVKEMIIRGGENLFPAEIENVLLEHPSVAEVAVVGLPDDTWGEVVAAFVRPMEGAKVEPSELRSHCRSMMSPQKTPSHWFSVPDFPLTGSGKIQKFALRDRFLAGDTDAL